MEPMKMVILGVVIVFLIIALFYLWKWLYGNADMEDIVVYSSANDGLPGKDKKFRIFNAAGQVPQIYPGGEYTISTWIYVTNWNINKGKNKPFLILSGGGNDYMTLVMYLGQYVNKLGVRASYESSDNKSGNLEEKRDYDAIVSGTSQYADGAFNKCDIESIDIQRWVNITAVLSGRTLDVYMDGKLSRSCLLDGLFKADGDSPTLKLGGPGGFGGLIGKTRAANFAYSPDRIYSNYQEGPFTTFSLSSLNPGDYSFDIKRKGVTIFGGQTSE
jgi:hypothetical protein